MKSKAKRKVEDIPIYPRNPDFIKELVTEIEKIQWPYAKPSVTDNRHYKSKAERTYYNLQERDQGLAALLALIGPRISEGLKFQRKYFLTENDRINVADFTPGKHGLLRSGLWLPKAGPLAPLTQVFNKWLVQVPSDPEAYVFPTAKPFGRIRWNIHIERARAYWIFYTTINKFPHWYRGVCETYVGKQIFRNDPYKLKKFMGVRRIESVYSYVGEPWEQDLENFSR